MIIILIHHTPLEVAAQAAGVCRNSKPTKELLTKVLGIGHEAIAEFVDVTFQINGVSRALTHQLVRHRIGCSYAQESQRHVDLTKDLDWCVIPDSIANNAKAIQVYHTVMQGIWHGYHTLVDMGIPREDARYVLPNAARTNIMVKMNARALYNFFKERHCKRAQWEIRGMAKLMHYQCLEQMPDIFKKSYLNCKHCKEPCGESNGNCV